MTLQQIQQLLGDLQAKAVQGNAAASNLLNQIVAMIQAGGGAPTPQLMQQVSNLVQQNQGAIQQVLGVQPAANTAASPTSSAKPIPGQLNQQTGQPFRFAMPDGSIKSFAPGGISVGEMDQLLSQGARPLRQDGTPMEVVSNYKGTGGQLVDGMPLNVFLGQGWLPGQKELLGISDTSTAGPFTPAAQGSTGGIPAGTPPAATPSPTTTTTPPQPAPRLAPQPSVDLTDPGGQVGAQKLIGELLQYGMNRQTQVGDPIMNMILGQIPGIQGLSKQLGDIGTQLQGQFATNTNQRNSLLSQLLGSGNALGDGTTTGANEGGIPGGIHFKIDVGGQPTIIQAPSSPEEIDAFIKQGNQPVDLQGNPIQVEQFQGGYLFNGLPLNVVNGQGWLPGQREALQAAGKTVPTQGMGALTAFQDAIARQNQAEGLMPQTLSALRSEATAGIPQRYNQGLSQLKVELARRGALGGQLPGSTQDIVSGYGPLIAEREALRAQAERVPIMANEQAMQANRQANRTQALQAAGGLAGLIPSVGSIFNPYQASSGATSALGAALGGQGLQTQTLGAANQVGQAPFGFLGNLATTRSGLEGGSNPWLTFGASLASSLANAARFV